jgi:hypothetical protein
MIQVKSEQQVLQEGLQILLSNMEPSRLLGSGQRAIWGEGIT